MAKIIYFSLNFPAYHPKRGQPTYFVEKIWESIYPEYSNCIEFEMLDKSMFNFKPGLFTPKGHTVRLANRWAAGDYFSPRAWLLPGGYYVKGNVLIKFGPEILIKKTWRLDIYSNKVYLDNKLHCSIDNKALIHQFAINDGLNSQELMDWFKLPKSLIDHKIICWNNSINYSL